MPVDEDMQEVLELQGADVAQQRVNEKQEGEEMVRGVRRHRSGVLRRPRSQAQLLSPPVLRDSPPSAKHTSAHNNDETGVDTSVRSDGKDFVYIRRGDAGKKSIGRNNNKDSKGDEGKGGGRRFEGKMIRQRVVSDIRPAKNMDEWRPTRGNVEDRDNSLDQESGRGSGGRADRSWEELSQKEEGRNRTLKINRDRFEGGRTMHPDGSAKRKQDFDSVDYSNGKTKDGRPWKAPELVKKRRHRLILQDNSDDDDYEPWKAPVKKDVSTSPSPTVKGLNSVKETEESTPVQEGRPGPLELQSQGVRKSSRVPKKKVLGDFEDYVPNDGIGDGSVDGESGAIERKSSEEDNDAVFEEKDAGSSDKDASGGDDSSEDVDGEFDSPKPKSGRPKDVPKTQDTFRYPGKGRNTPLTARQRTMQLGKDREGDIGESLIEFPTGLMHQTRRGRDKLTEEERQVKKTEASNRRKQQVEKAATEIQATAIQKILGQDSSRKRKEERLLKRRTEIEQGKKAAALEPPANIVRWTFGPTMTTVWWSRDVELPSCFSSSSGPPSYPPAREKCAGPTCTNVYKYRDSKSRLPLCSLQCYRSIQPAAGALLST